MVETQEYKVPASAYGHAIGSKILSKWWWAAALPIAVGIVASFYDWRWLVALLALILVLYPGVLLLGYCYYALSPEMTKAILPQRAIFEPEGIRIVYCRDDNKLPASIYSLDEILCTRAVGKYFEIELKDKFVYKIPISAFEGAQLPKNYKYAEEIVTNCS